MFKIIENNARGYAIDNIKTQSKSVRGEHCVYFISKIIVNHLDQKYVERGLADYFKGFKMPVDMTDDPPQDGNEKQACHKGSSLPICQYFWGVVRV